MDIARDSNIVAFSAKVKLVQESGHDLQNGFLMYLPLYRNGADIENIAQRRKELLGYVYSPLCMDNLIKGILLSARNQQINFSIYDRDSQAVADLLYSPKIKPDPLSNADIKAFTPHLSVVKAIEFPGRNWTLHFRSTDVFKSTVKNNLTTLIGFTGTTLLIFLLFVLLNIAVAVQNRSRQAQNYKY
jgi:CHASE1-domain containing sensor protein